MGSIITLGIEKMELDWGKNYFFSDHSKLFQKDDYNYKIPYFYIDDEGNEIVEYKNGARKPLMDVKERLDLLGYSLNKLEELYNEHCKIFNNYNLEEWNISYDEFYEFVLNIDISKVDNFLSSIEYWDNGLDIGEYFEKCILSDNEIVSKIEKTVCEIKNQLQFNEFGTFFENMNPYITLRILAENPRNSKYNVEWRYADVIENGWADESLYSELDKENKILIVTEGSTDSFVIKKTINELYPNIADFFEFIDMENNYPFTGVGNLSNFCIGLSKIQIQNNILIIFDNDTAGTESFNKVNSIVKDSSNMVICKLPSHKEFEEFNTIGPGGENIDNINAKAVAIECFLDFSKVNFLPKIRWTSYNNKMGMYQGIIENKEEYIKTFKDANLLDGTYDCSKLKYLVDFLIKSWVDR